LQRHLLKHPGGDRVMAQVLAAIPVHGLDAVLVAVELALESGRPSGEHVLNVLARLKDESAPVPAIAARRWRSGKSRRPTSTATTLYARRGKRRPIMSVELIARLKALKLHGMASSWPELAARARHSEFDPEQWMLELLAAEGAEREVRSIAYQMTAARFPAHRDLAGFEFAQSKADEALVRRLHAGEFMEPRRTWC
jgi:hypothetical protein